MWSFPFSVHVGHTWGSGGFGGSEGDRAAGDQRGEQLEHELVLHLVAEEDEPHPGAVASEHVRHLQADNGY